MTAFDDVWDSSRTNCWTVLYPVVIAIGVLVLIRVSFIKPVIKRRLIKVASFVVLTATATVASSLAIGEKWRIRHEWTDTHAEIPTEDQRMASISDGGNLVFGPILFGCRALVIFTGVLLALSIAARLGKKSSKG